MLTKTNRNRQIKKEKCRHSERHRRESLLSQLSAGETVCVLYLHTVPGAPTDVVWPRWPCSVYLGVHLRLSGISPVVYLIDPITATSITDPCQALYLRFFVFFFSFFRLPSFLTREVSHVTAVGVMTETETDRQTDRERERERERVKRRDKVSKRQTEGKREREGGRGG